MTRPPALGLKPLTFARAQCGYRTASLRELIVHRLLYHAWRKTR